MARTLSPLFTWRSAVASPFGPDSSTRRHILLTLSLHMNEKGGSCYPGHRRLSRETGFNRSTVVEHLATAEEEGWVVIERREGTSNRYRSTIPRSFWTALYDALEEGDELAQELVRSSPDADFLDEEDEESTQGGVGEDNTPAPESGGGGVGEDDGGVGEGNRGCWRGQHKDDTEDVTKDDNNHSRPRADARPEPGGGGSVEKNSGDGHKVQSLIEIGVAERQARELVDEYDWDVIYRQVQHYRHKCERGGQYRPDGPGWIVSAVREGYTLPPAVRQSSPPASQPRSLPSSPRERARKEGPADDEIPDEPPDFDLDEICGFTPGSTPLTRNRDSDP